eukprot:TRINITY_DN509_c0_g2_i1.p1 TRINITY_DN509_c0_g2~~TRINITY_DN509_c0_g2_i1.p1  ORF type:complete len:601 (-),score=97.11 TRINITY_DN509_c0_g2_i1:84-1781(-)
MLAIVNFRLALLVSAAFWHTAAGNRFLSSSQDRLSPGDHNFEDAVKTVIGCGTVREDRLNAEARLETMWRVLPKNKQGRAEWGLMRYVIHRYFMQEYNLLLRGFEPSLVMNSSSLGGELGFLREHDTFSVIDGALSQKGRSTGFSFPDAVAMVAALEQVISEQDGTTLRKAYTSVGMHPSSALNHEDLATVAEAFLIHLLVEADAVEAIDDKSLLIDAVPHWKDISDFVSGAVKSIEFEREHNMRPGNSHVALSHKYSFDDAREVVDDITRSFGSFWETECQAIKASLLKLDKHSSGRVSLSDFYGANVDGEWRFAESEAYLRKLGALDESSPDLGKQLIIPNYMQGANNCLITTRSYFICCVNECETVLQDLEGALGGPVAEPDRILHLVGNMTNFEDDAPVIDALLLRQLERIAHLHGGKIPLHGRLFAQWLHFVFPAECPFPHVAGAVSAMPVSAFDDVLASPDVVARHAASRNSESAQTQDEREALPLQLMSQWSEDEELIADYSAHLRAPWDDKLKRIGAAGGISAVLALVWMTTLRGGVGSGNAQSSGDACAGHRTHFL